MGNQQGTNRSNPYIRWLYIAGGLLILTAVMIFSTGSAAGDRLGLAVLQIGSIAIIGAAVAGAVTWRPTAKKPYHPWPAGWYERPEGQRYWDGERWTEQVKP